MRRISMIRGLIAKNPTLFAVCASLSQTSISERKHKVDLRKTVVPSARPGLIFRRRSRPDTSRSLELSAGHPGTNCRTAAGGAECAVGRRQRMDAGFGRAGSADDRTGVGAFLRRPGSEEEHLEHHDAE